MRTVGFPHLQCHGCRPRRRVLKYPSTDKSRKTWVVAYVLTGLVALLGCVLVMVAAIIGQGAVQDAAGGLRYANYML